MKIMKLEINYLNDENFKEDQATWYSRWKKYESEQMDEDMLNCPISHKIDRVILNDTQITVRSQADDLIKFLENLKPSLQR